MAYPTVPDLVPFEPDMRPNLLLIGLYDQQLTTIENYLKQLGAYVDKQDSALSERITVLEGDVADLKRRMSAAEDTIAEHTETLADHETRIKALEPYVAAIKTPVNVAVPTRIGDSGTVTEKQNAAVLSFTGDGTVTMSSPALEALVRLIANLMLAAPNDDHESVLGYLAGNTETLTTAAESVRSSAALTVAYESGPALPEQNPDGDAVVTAGEISHVSDAAGTDGPGLFKTSDGWVYVGTPTT